MSKFQMSRMDDYMTMREAFSCLQSNDFKYKGKSIIWRTMRTMVERSFFKTAVKIGGMYFVKTNEIQGLVGL